VDPGSHPGSHARTPEVAPWTPEVRLVASLQGEMSRRQLQDELALKEATCKQYFQVRQEGQRISARSSRAIGVQCAVMATSDERAAPEQSRADDHALEPTHDEQGVDLTLIDEMLRLEPIERLRMNDRAINAVLELRDAFAAKP
jgi:hypothetical protein